MSQKINLTLEESKKLKVISGSRKKPLREVLRAKILLSLYKNENISSISKCLKTSRPTIYKCFKKFLAGGIDLALKDTYHRPHPPIITKEAKAWVVNIACTKPKDLGYAAEIWTRKALAKHVRKNAEKENYLCLKKAVKATVHRILKEQSLRPHKISYYLEKRDEKFEEKMRTVLAVYKEVNLQNETQNKKNIITVSVDEKPGVQAIKNIAPDLPPKPSTPKKNTLKRDYEYKRLGTLSILAALDLHTGKIIGQVHERHRSIEFISLLKELDSYYPKDCVIRVILDNHSAHISKETLTYLETRPNRFKYVHTPKHGSWLNLIEGLFSKMARTFLKHIRVDSKEELKERILKGIKEINEEGVIHKWKKFNFDQV